jgi:hypothetical protein
MTLEVIATLRDAAETEANKQETLMQRVILVVVLAAFTALTAVAVWRHGYLGIFEHQLLNAAGLQVLADLGIALALVLTWLWSDAKRLGRNPIPWVVLTLAAGSFGPLLYLLTRREE